MAKANTKIKAQTQTTLEKEVRALGGGIKSSIVDTLGIGGLGEAWTELVGSTLGTVKPQTETSPEASKKQDGPLTLKDPVTGEIQVFSSAEHKGQGAPRRTPEKPQSRQEAAMHYSSDIKSNGEKALRKEHKSEAEQVQELKMQLNQIAKSSEQRTKIAPITLNQDTRRVGKSDIGFLQLAVRSIKEKPEDANSWLNVTKKKNGSKKATTDITSKHQNAGEIATSGLNSTG